MKKIQMKWERNGYTLRTFEDGKAEKYYQDCFTKTDTEVYRLTGTAGAFTHDQIIQYYDRIVDDPARYDFIITDPNGTCFLASNFPHFHRYDSLKSALYIHAVSKNINTFPKNQGRIRAAIAVKILDFTVMYR